MNARLLRLLYGFYMFYKNDHFIWSQIQVFDAM